MGEPIDFAPQVDPRPAALARPGVEPVSHATTPTTVSPTQLTRAAA